MREMIRNRHSSFLIPVIILLCLTAIMFGDVLFTLKDTVLSSKDTDLFHEFAHLRKFGFGQLGRGNIALWNPYLFSGMPHLGEFQSAILYPPNFVYLILPLPRAINLGIALHVFLAGLFMYLWTAHRGLHPLACLFSSVLLMFCGAHFMHVYAGHLSNLCTMIWAPLLFLSIDGLFEKRSFSWCLLGMFAVLMQILAGHPQYVFYTAIAATIYSGLRIAETRGRAKVALGLLSMYAGATALGAVQLLPGIQAARESIRSSGLSFGFASMFSFPPENFITLLAPRFFGDETNIGYWGRCYLWEMSLFIGVTGFILAIYGSIYGKRKLRYSSMTMTLILLLLALGAHTPLFRFLYTWVPGLKMFRGSSKFIFQASIFIIMLAGIGLDHLIRYKRIHRRTVLLILVAGFLLGTAALCIRSSATAADLNSTWNRIMAAVCNTNESFMSAETYTDAKFVQRARLFASGNLLISAGTCLLLALLFSLVKFSHKFVYIIALIGIIEVFVFARSFRPTFDMTQTQVPELQEFYANHPGDYRVLDLVNSSGGVAMGAQDIMGFAPGMIERYAEFIAFTQNQDPDKASQYVKVSHWHSLYKMLRCRYIFSLYENKIRIVEFKDVMSRLHLIQKWSVLTNRDDIFAAMEGPAFDPRQTVILESSPDPEPVKAREKGTAMILDSSTDHITIEANLPEPAILLITDAYSSGWRARPLTGSIQEKYDLMPANYILRAIPLSEGHHRLRVEYLPIAFRFGKWVSIVSAIIVSGFLVYYRRKRGSKLPGFHHA